MDTTTHDMQAPPSAILWTTEDIAAFYKRSPRQAQRLVKCEGFPPHAKGDSRRWVATQVIAFATDNGTDRHEPIGPAHKPGARITRPSQRNGAQR